MRVGRGDLGERPLRQKMHFRAQLPLQTPYHRTAQYDVADGGKTKDQDFHRAIASFRIVWPWPFCKATK